MPPNRRNAPVTSLSILMVSTDVQMDGSNSDGGLRLGASRGKKAIYIYMALIWVVVEISAGTCCDRSVERQMRCAPWVSCTRPQRRHISEVIHYVLHTIARPCRTATTTRSIQLYVRRWRIRVLRLRQRASAFNAVLPVRCRRLSRVSSAFVSLLIISTNVVGVAYEMDWWVDGSSADVWRHLLLYSGAAYQSSAEY